MYKLNMKLFGHFCALSAAIILLVSSNTFLMDKPLIGGLILAFFSALYVQISLSSRSQFFIYPASLLFIFSYYLFNLSIVNLPAYAPLLSLPLAGLFLVVAKKAENSYNGHFAGAVYHVFYGLVLFFFLYIIWSVKDFYTIFPMVPMITFLVFSAMLGIRTIQTKKVRFAYWALFNISLSFLALIHLISHASLIIGFCLIMFFMGMMYMGSCLLKSSSFYKNLDRAFYSIGYAGLVCAPLYFVNSIPYLIIVQALYTLFFWHLKQRIYPVSGDLTPCPLLCKIFIATVAASSIAGFILTLLYYFNYPTIMMISGLIFSLSYLRQAYNTRLYWDNRADLLIYLAILFFALSYFASPLPHISSGFHLIVLCAWISLALISKSHEFPRLCRALSRGQFILLAVILLFPAVFDTTRVMTLLYLDAAYLLMYMGVYYFDRWEGYLYSLPIIGTHLYYIFLISVISPGSNIGLYFLLPIILLYILKFFSRTSHLFYFSWMCLTFASLCTIIASHISAAYMLALWAVLYLVESCFVKIKKSPIKYYLSTCGTTLAFIAIIFSFGYYYFGDPLPGLVQLRIIFAVLFIAYMIVFIRRKTSFYLYLSCLTGSVLYYLVIMYGHFWDIAHLLSIPLLIISYGLYVFFSHRGKESFEALKNIGHLDAFVFTLMLFLHNRSLHSVVVLSSLTIYFLLYFLINLIREGYDFTFLAATAGCLLYYYTISHFPSLAVSDQLRLVALIMVPLTELGYYFFRKGKEIKGMAIFDLIVFISLITSLVSLFGGYVYACQFILILSSILFVIITLIIKKDFFIYLTTLCLGLTAYNFLQIANQKFTQDLVVYILYALIFIGIFFGASLFKRLLNYRGPRYMIASISWKSYAFYSLIIVGFTVLLFFLFSIEIANYPGFCTRCHYMKPYAEAWEHSTHNGVNCVDCHYEPGLNAMIDTKIKGMVHAVKYFTNTYSNKPKSEISDNTCLRSGCHSKQDLSKDLTFGRGIHFDHTSHLITMRRGKKLRCTTCHSQIVQGDHLTVTKSICFTCHFKGSEDEGPAVGKCILCHVIPEEVVSYQGVEFDHVSFLEGKPSELCSDCHADVTEGDGAVPKERCYSCHAEEDPDLSDSVLLHNKHITERKIECFECHLDIQHGRHKDSKHLMMGNCGECHTFAHTTSEKMYLGLGGIGVKGEPDPMFTARVSCNGCHKQKQKILIGDFSFVTTKANLNVCDECHGLDTGYTEMAREWQDEVKVKLDEIITIKNRLDPEIQKIRDIDRNTDYGTVLFTIITIYEQAHSNLDFIISDGSYGVHNYSYTIDLLMEIKKDFLACRMLLQQSNEMRD
ncbi:MAG: NapC/NirT family cytochrome c [bacterium]